MSRVVVSGMGIRSSLGNDLPTFWSNLIAGKSGISDVKSFDTTEYDVHRGGEIHNFSITIGRIVEVGLGRCSSLAVEAAYDALSDSDLKIDESRRIAVVVGTTMGESQLLEGIDKELLEEKRLIEKSMLRVFSANNIAESISRLLDLNGSTTVIPTACAAGNYCIGYAADLIESGAYDYVLAGGAEAMSRIAYTGFSRIFAIAPDCCQPFDVNRKGIMVGEGAGILLLENKDLAIKRGHSYYGEVGGYAISSDASHMVIPNEDGIYRAMKNALSRSNISASEVNYISAHGTGTQANDAAECAAINHLFRTEKRTPPLSSIKSMLGHTMGAASAIEAIACLLSIKNGSIPPTINFKQKDPKCDVDCVPNEARKIAVKVAMNNAFAFGGNNSCVIFTKP